jgi:mono/diheme cytochrome c family protein
VNATTKSRAALVVASTLLVALIIGRAERAPAADAPPSIIARGEYLVGDAGQCRDCHGQNLEGGPAPKGPPGVPWAANAPSLVPTAIIRCRRCRAIASTPTMPRRSSPICAR